MTSAPPAEQTTAVVSEPRLWRFTVEQYHRMIESGILTENDPVELLEGWLLEKMPKKLPHIYSTQQARDIFAALLPAGWFVSDQEPITTEDSEPEPDVIVVRGVRKDFANRPVQPIDVGLIIEVSDTTLRYDRTVKLRIYARAHIPVYWILNLPERTLEVYTEPSGDEYRQRRTYVETDTVPVILDGQEVGQLAVSELFS
jgi:Uma2 family endonuclease